jgi:hypothetical protein
MMKKVIFIAVVVLSVCQVFVEKVTAFEISNIAVDGNQVVLQTTYGGDFYLERGRNAKFFSIELHADAGYASIGDSLNKEVRTPIRFLDMEDFRIFEEFLKSKSWGVGYCFSGPFKKCVVYIF